MPEFSPGESKIAISPITAKPAGMACESELFLGPDELAKVATSGRIPFVSAGASQPVRLPIAMPSEPGTYHGYIDVYTGGIRFLAYKTIKDITIVGVLDLGEIIILGIDGKPFIITGIDTDGLPYGILAEPTIVDALWPKGVTVNFKYVGQSYDKMIYSGITFLLWYDAPAGVEFPCDSPPALRLYSYPAPTYCTDPPYCTTTKWVVPFEGDAKIQSYFGGGYWCPLIYGGVIQWSLTLGDAWGWAGGGKFRVYNMVKCTGKGRTPEW